MRDSKPLVGRAACVPREAPRLLDSPQRRREVRAALRVIRYVWICLAFLSLWLHFSYVQLEITVPRGLLYSLYALGVASIALRNALALRFGSTLLQSLLFNLLAVTFIALGVAATGKIESDLWIVYFLFILSETLFVDQRVMLATDLVVALSYLAATWPGRFTLPYAEQLGTRIFFLVLVGGIARAIAANESERGRELALLREQVAVAEERARIAREIHDGVGHALTGAILQLELCQRLLRRDPEAAEAVLDEQKGLLRHAMNEARELVFQMRPMELAASGFAASVRRYAQQLTHRADVSVEVSLPEGELPLSPAAELALARIIQEALANAARHSGARRISVVVSVDAEAVRCLIEDDGRGFDVEAPAPRAGGFGLHGMKERAAALGGQVAVDSAPGRGTRVSVTLPAR